MVRILGSTGTRRRRRYQLAALFSVAAVLALIAVPASAVLPGSTFEGNDGNLVVDTAGNTDWANAPNRVVGLDQPSGSTDNSFGQGTKEDNANATVVTGSIPPNKNDLTRFYVGSEFVSGSNFLYLAWERAVNIGNANLDLELSQNATAGFTGTTTGPVTLNRTAGDILITYDFSGSGTPTLGLLKWVTSGPTSQCFSSNSLPCWGNRVNLSAAGSAEGAVNTGTVTDPVPPNAPRTLTTGLFGEAAVNLTAAGVFPAGTCEAFGSTFLKSRASSSFGAEVKDFIAPQPVPTKWLDDAQLHFRHDAVGFHAERQREQLFGQRCKHRGLHKGGRWQLHGHGGGGARQLHPGEPALHRNRGRLWGPGRHGPAQGQYHGCSEQRGHVHLHE
jgi:hypothetical protein